VSNDVTDELTQIAGDYGMVMTYNAVDAVDPWKAYDPAIPVWANDLTTLNSTEGVWVWMHRAASWSITLPTTKSNSVVPLRAGWNLVGYPWREARALPDALGSLSGYCEVVYGYLPQGYTGIWQRYVPGYPDVQQSLRVMEPGKGYWISVTEDCLWQVD
jgi:hypothetical protein